MAIQNIIPEITNPRGSMKGSIIPGVRATIPNSSLTYHTEDGWLPTDLYVGEWYINYVDDVVEVRTENGIIQLDSTTSGITYEGLINTPSGFTGMAGYAAVVNGSESGMEFVEYATPQTIEQLLDTPSGYTDGSILVSTLTDFEYQPYIDNFISQVDTPTGYTDFDGQLLRVNLSEDGIEFIDGDSLYCSLSGTQYISGTKTFDDIIVNNTLITPEITLNTNNITDLITDTGLTGSNDWSIPSSLAVKTYIDDQVIAAVGGDYVVRTGAVTVEDVKTFTDTPIFNSNIDVDGDINVSTHLYITGNTTIGISSSLYFGQTTTLDTNRLSLNGNADLEISKYTDSGWTYKDNFTNRKELRIAEDWNDTTEPLIDKIESTGVALTPTGTSLATTQAIYEMIAGSGMTTLWQTSAGTYSVQTLYTGCQALGHYSVADGFNTTANGNASRTEGWGTITWGDGSHAEGKDNIASGDSSHAEGENNIASGEGSHAEGYGFESQNIASGLGSHTEGIGGIASGEASHAEGKVTEASGDYSHSEGWNTWARGDGSHAEGIYTTAAAEASHTGGKGVSDTYTVVAAGVASFNHSYVTNGSSAIGVTGDYSAILGGTNMSLTRANTVAIPNLDIRGDITKSYVTFTSDETINTEEIAIIYIDATTSGVTVVLPDATTVDGREYKIKCIDDTNTVTVDGGIFNIDDSTTYELVLNETITLHSDGIQWRIL